jgi:alginate O-acetyltransferase complex protein AlgI
MLFNSIQFMVGFLPVTLAVFAMLVRNHRAEAAKIWLCLASLFFYGSWSIKFLPVLLISVLVNYFIVRLLLATTDEKRRGFLLIIGVTANLGALAYFKYLNFFLDSLGSAVNVNFNIARIALPLGISFFTFQKIALLVDVRGGMVKDISFIDYCLFALFFPQLISGPLVHHREVVPQYQALGKDGVGLQADSFARGLTVFTIGLFKKVVLADGILSAVTSIDRVFSPGTLPSTDYSFFEAWGATLAYGLQLYFDFSGYSDMAIGLGLLFGVQLPLNFNSPFKSSSIIEFWSRWHMSLTRFLNAYLYNPMRLRVSRSRMQRGKPLIQRGTGPLDAFFVLVAWPTVYTMTLAGVWHGAGWQFIVFGMLHGGFLTFNHMFHYLKKSLLINWEIPTVLAVALTYVCANIGFVFFRSQDLVTAKNVLVGMSGVHGFVLPKLWEAELGPISSGLSKLGVSFGSAGSFDRSGMEIIWIAALMLIVFALPNTQEIMGLPIGERASRGMWEPSYRWLAYACVGVAASIPFVTRVTEFIYFQF